MAIFEEAIEKATSLTFEDIFAEGYPTLEHSPGSLFHFAKKEGGVTKAIINSIHIAPNIGVKYQLRRMDNIALEDLLEREYEIYCYHYNFSENLEEHELLKAQVTSAYDILQFWEENNVDYEIDS